MAVYELSAGSGKYYDDVSKEFGGKELLGKGAQPEVSQPAAQPEEGAWYEDVNWPRVGSEVLGGLIGGAAALPTGPAGILIGAGLGAEAGGQISDIGQRELGGVDIEPTGLLGATTNVATNIAGQKAGGLLQPAGAYVAGLMAPVKNRMFGGEAKDIVNQFANLGIGQPSAGMVTGNRWIQGVEEGLHKMPGSAKTMREYTESVLSGLGDAQSQMAAQVGTSMSREGASDILTEGALEATKRFKGRRQELQDALVEKVGPDAMSPMTATQGIAESMTRQQAAAPGARKFMTPAIKEAQGIVGEQGEIPYSALREARTDLGARLEQPPIAGGYVGPAGASMRRVYGALKSDLDDMAKEYGEEHASNVLDRYTRYYSNISKPDLIKAVKRDDRAYKWLMEGTDQSGKRLGRMRNNLKSDEWDDIVATTVNRMGMAKPGTQNAAGDVFSPQSFMTEWNKLSPEAKNALFSGKKYTELRKSLNDLVGVSEAIKDMSYVKNPSGTAGMERVMEVLSSPTAMLSMLGMTMPQRVLAKKMVDPKFVNWLVDGAKVSPMNENAISAHMARLPAIVGREYLSEDQQ